MFKRGFTQDHLRNVALGAAAHGIYTQVRNVRARYNRPRTKYMPARPNRNRPPGRRGFGSSRYRRKGTRAGRSTRSRRKLKTIAVAASETKLRKTVYDYTTATQPNGMTLENTDVLTEIPTRAIELRGISESRATPAVNVSPVNVCVLSTANIINSGWNFIHKDGETDVADPEPGYGAGNRFSDVKNIVPNGVNRFERIGDRLSEVNINYQSSWEIVSNDGAAHKLMSEFRVIKGYFKQDQVAGLKRFVTDVTTLTSVLPFAYLTVVEDYIVKRTAQYTGLANEAGVQQPVYEPIKIDFNAYLGRIRSYGSKEYDATTNNPVPEMLLQRTPFVAIINDAFDDQHLKVKFVRHNVTYKDM